MCAGRPWTWRVSVRAVARGVAVGAIRLYKRIISPLLPPSCRFSPSCSEYTRLAIQKHGLVRGGAMGVWRILRCNPFCRGGFDPVR